MEKHDLKLRMDNLKLLIEIEKENFVKARMERKELSVLVKLKENLLKFMEELRVLENRATKSL